MDTSKEEDGKISDIYGCGIEYLLYLIILSKTNN